MSAISYNNEARRTCVFHSNWMQVAKTITDMKVRCIFYEAALQYALDGTKIDVPPELNLVLTFVYGLIDEDREKYRRICKIRAEAGKNHKGNQYTNRLEQNGTNGTNGTNVPILEQNGTNGTDTDTDILLNENSKKEIIAKKKAASAATLEQRKQQFQESLLPYVEIYGSSLLNNFYEYWTEENKSGTKMRFELEKTWDPSRRLARWANNERIK